MKYYTVIDTNVLVSATIKWQSIPGTVVELAMKGSIIPLLNHEIVNEYQAVLSRPKFGLSDDIVNDIVAGMQKHGLYVDEESLDIALPDPKDRVFYEVVMEERKERDAYLVTGNIKHFPSEPFVVTPRQMVDIIMNDA